MIVCHKITTENFTRIARGNGDAEATALLAATQLSRNLLMLGHIAQRDSSLSDAIELLSAAHEQAPQQTASVIRYPWVGAGAARAVAVPEQRTGASHLRCVAAAAALRAGLDGVVPPPGMVVPTVGVVRDDGVEPVRQITAKHRGYRITVLIDDLDVHRGCHDYPVAARLSEAQWQEWRSGFVSAWRLLADYAPERCAELAVGLASIVPLAESHGTGVSVTHSDAFGGLGCTRPPDPAQFACVLVHEYQHSKLNALMGLIPLHDPQFPTEYTVPWRRDMRPLGGVLHGLYAFTAVAGWWAALRADSVWEPVATAEFSRIRRQVARVMNDVMDSPGLTPAGQRFTSVLGTSIARL